MDSEDIFSSENTMVRTLQSLIVCLYDKVYFSFLIKWDFANVQVFVNFYKIVSICLGKHS